MSAVAETAAERALHPAVADYLTDGTIRCDTPRCESVHWGGGWNGAVDAAWRTDALGLRRCPKCLASPWPGADPETDFKVPVTAYRAWWKGDKSRLTEWLDKKFGPLPKAPEPAEPVFRDPEPVQCPQCYGLLERPGQDHEPCSIPVTVITVVPARPVAEPELDPETETHLAAFNVLHDEQDALEARDTTPGIPAASPDWGGGDEAPETEPDIPPGLEDDPDDPALDETRQEHGE